MKAHPTLLRILNQCVFALMTAAIMAKKGKVTVPRSIEIAAATDEELFFE